MRDTIEMAREAGLLTWLKPPEDVIERFKAFEALVRADEREASIDAVLQIIKELRPALVLVAFADRDKAWMLDKVKESIEKLKELTNLFMDSYEHGVEDTKQSAIEGIQKAVLLEREACYTIAKFNQSNHLEHLTADQIKARGEIK